MLRIVRHHYDIVGQAGPPLETAFVEALWESTNPPPERAGDVPSGYAPHSGRGRWVGFAASGHAGDMT